MATQSGAVVFSFENVADFYSVINFLEQHSGIRVIYKTMKTNDRLYITSEKEMQRQGRDNEF